MILAKRTNGLCSLLTTKRKCDILYGVAGSSNGAKVMIKSGKLNC